jgi:hypothetical protein
MNDEQTTYPAAGLARSRGARCAIGALFTAGVSMALVNLFDMANLTIQPYLFLLVLLVAFVGGQIQERMRRLSD